MQNNSTNFVASNFNTTGGGIFYYFGNSAKLNTANQINEVEGVKKFALLSVS